MQASVDRQNLIYMYDLPKEDYTSTALAKLLKDRSGIDLARKPQVKRDPNRPFYTAIMSIPDPEQFKEACKALRYFEMAGKPCRALPFDNELTGANIPSLSDNNIFVHKIPKEMSAQQLEDEFSKYGEIKSLKISLNEDHKSRGYGFVCFQESLSAKKALENQ